MSPCCSPVVFSSFMVSVTPAGLLTSPDGFKKQVDINYVPLVAGFSLTDKYCVNKYIFEVAET